MRDGPSAEQRDDVASFDDECIALIADLFRGYDLPRSGEGWLTPIDWDLASEAELGEQAIEDRARDLSMTRVETFLGEIAAALGELQRASERYDDLRRQVTALAIDRLEQEGEESIRDQEIDDGFLDIESRVADADAAGQVKWAAATADSAQRIEEMQSDPFFEQVSQNGPAYVAHIRASVDTAGLYSTYKTVHDRETPDKTNLDNDTIWMSDPFNVLPGSRPPDVVSDRGGRTGFVAYRNAHYKAAYAVVGLESYAQKTQLVSQSAISRGLAGSAEDTSRARQIWSTWKRAEVTHRQRRIELRRLLNAVKRRSSKQAGAPMEFGRELRALRDGFCTTLSICLAKMDVSASALSRMFGVGVSQGRPEIAGWQDAQGSYIAALDQWYARIRAALEVALGSDGSELVSVSMARLIGRNDFDAIAAAARGTRTASLIFEFQLPLSLFSGMDAVRIAGLTGYARLKGGGETGPWRARVAPPSRTRNILGGRPTPAYEQPRRTTDLGRVADRGAIRTPDINGLAALRNLQPFSGDAATVRGASWRLEIDRYSISGEDACDLDDLELDIIVNVRRD